MVAATHDIVLSDFVGVARGVPNIACNVLVDHLCRAVAHSVDQVEMSVEFPVSLRHHFHLGRHCTVIFVGERLRWPHWLSRVVAVVLVSVRVVFSHLHP